MTLQRAITLLQAEIKEEQRKLISTKARSSAEGARSMGIIEGITQAKNKLVREQEKESG